MSDQFISSQTYYNELVRRLRAPEPHVVHLNTFDRTPHFVHNNYRDYHFYLNIGGRDIQVWGGRCDNPGDGNAEMLILPYSEHHRTGEMRIGYKTRTGIYLSLDIRYAKYVKWNDDRSAYEEINQSELPEDQPSAAQLIIEHFGIEEFLNAYVPPTLEEIMRDTWATKRDLGIRTANRRAIRLAEQTAHAELQVSDFKNQLRGAKATLAEWANMSLEKFMETADRYRHQLDAVGDITTEDGAISVSVKRFTVEEIELGPFVVRYDMANSNVTVQRGEGCGESVNGYFHPHVCHDGSVCWGHHTNIYQASLGNPFEALFLTVEFLKTGYYDGGAYHKLSHWEGDPSWYCDYCDESHPNEEGCPRECGECETHVNWDYHMYCHEHGECFNTEEDPGKCSVCHADEVRAKKEAEEEEARLAAEEEAAEAAEKQKVDESEAKTSKKKTKKKATKKKRKKAAKKKASRRTTRRSQAA